MPKSFQSRFNIYLTQHLRKLCFVAMRKGLNIQRILNFRVWLSVHFSSEGYLFEFIAPIVVLKVNAKVDWSSPHFSQNCNIV